MIKAVIFDCFGVLTADAWHEFRLSLETEKGRQAHELMHQYSAGFLPKGEFVTQAATVTGVSEKEISGYIESGTSKNRRLFEYISDLKRRGYKLGILSNVANNWITDSFLSVDEQTMFAAMVFSFEVGTTKPDTRIYEEMLKKLDVAAEEAVFIDDIERYCLAAQDLGMKAILYQDFPQFKDDLEEILKNRDKNHIN